MRLVGLVGTCCALAIFAAGVAASQASAGPATSLVAAQVGSGPGAGGFGDVSPATPAASPAATPRPAPTAAPHSSAPVVKPKPAPAPALVVRTTQQRMINQDRARYGLAPLTWSPCLANVAAYEARHLAQPGVAFRHYDGVSRDLGCHIGRQVGENIGWYSAGANDTWMNSAFMASPDHRANILGPYRYVATAWAVRSDGTAFIAVEFG